MKKLASGAAFLLVATPAHAQSTVAILDGAKNIALGLADNIVWSMGIVLTWLGL